MTADAGFTFRAIEPDDLPLLHRWLNEPEVVAWWEGEDVSWQAVQRDYGPGAEGPYEQYLAEWQGKPIGWIQCSLIAAEAEDEEFFRPLGLDRTAATIDYLLGERTDRGRGLGTAMIRAFLVDIVFGRHPGWSQVCVAPQAANEPSWRALANAGFRHVATLPDPLGPCRAMLLEREPRGVMGA